MSERLSLIGSRPDLPGLQEQRERVRDISVCLITPPSGFLADQKVFPSLGIVKIGAELGKGNGNPVYHLDLSGVSNFEDAVRDYMQNFQTCVFALTATTPQFQAAVKIRDEIKRQNPNALVIVGGPHVTAAYTGLQQDNKRGITSRGTKAFEQLTSLFDKIVVGDGENAIFYAIDPDYPEQVIDASRRDSPLFMQRGDLDKYLPPDRDLLDFLSYHYQIDGHKAFSVIAQLGCPFGCGFCGMRRAQTFRMIRTRSVENVVKEIESIVKWSVDMDDPMTGVMFYDDELNVSPQGLEELCKSLIDLQKKLAQDISPETRERLGIQTEVINEEERVVMRFRGFVKAELFTQEQADLMYDAGFRIVLTGVESGSDKMLKAMNKGTSRETNANLVRYAHNAGLKVKALMSIGHPGESRESVALSLNWVMENLRSGDDVDFTIITPYPGSPYHDDATYVPEKNAYLYTVRVENEKLELWSREINYVEEADFYKGVPGDYKAKVWTENLTACELVELRDRVEQEARNFLQLPPISEMIVPARQFEHSMGQREL